MGSEKWTDKHFGKRVKAERDNRGWSQADMAKKLSDNGIQPMHPTTMAKIEAGDRSVRINEAVGMADLFEVSLDSLLGRKPRPDRDLEYALHALMDAVNTSRSEVERISRSLRDRLEDIPADFAGYDTLAGHGRKVFTHLNTTREVLRKLEDQLRVDMEPWTRSAIRTWTEHLAERTGKERKPPAKEPQK